MRLTFHSDRKRFVFRCCFEDKDLPKKCGFRWDPQHKEWWTDTYTIAARLRKFADEAAQNAFAEQALQIKQSMSKAAEIEIPTPPGLELMPFQKAGVQYILSRKHTLLADEMGLGKTITSIGVMNITNPNRVLVVCPASLKLNWERELTRWLIHPYKLRRIDTSEPFEWNEREIIIVNYERLQPLLSSLNRPFDLFIVDECHKAKNPKAQRTKAVFELFKQAGKTIFATGSPMPNRPVELFPLLHAAFPERWDKFMPFARRYCGAFHDGYGWRFDGAVNLEELHTWLRAYLMIRRLKKDVLDELPEKIYQVIPFEQNDERIRDLLCQETGLFSFGDGFLDEDALFNRINELLKPENAERHSQLMAIRHDLALKKIPLTIEYIKECLENTDKLVVFAHHRDVLEALHGAFENSVLLYGGMSDTAKQSAVDTFQNDNSCNLFVGSIQAAGLGYTLTAANTVLFHELDFVTGNMQQAEDRVHRIGQKNTVNIQYLVFEDSLDERLLQILRCKARWQVRTLDDKNWSLVRS